MSRGTCTPRKPWELAFAAEPAEVASLRRILRLHLGIWGLQHVTDDAQLCLSELVSNVITHVGDGTPATLAVAMNGTYLRIEVHDPDVCALPTLVEAGTECENGRGMALVHVTATRWGVDLRADHKVTWCELATEEAQAPSVGRSPRLSRAQELQPCIEEAAVDIIVDLLHWLHGHGTDPEELLDRAQTHFEADAKRCAETGRAGLVHRFATHSKPPSVSSEERQPSDVPGFLGPSGIARTENTS